MIYVIADRTPWASATERDVRSRLQKPESPHAPLLLPRHRWHRDDRQRRYRAGKRRGGPRRSHRALGRDAARQRRQVLEQRPVAAARRGRHRQRSVPSHSRPIALKGAVTAFLEAMLGVVPRLGVIIAHEDQRPALALSCYRWASGSNRRSTGFMAKPVAAALALTACGGAAAPRV